LGKLRFARVLDGDTPVRDADSTDWKPCREIIADAGPTSSSAVESATTSSGKSGFKLPGWSVGIIAAAALTLIFVWPHLQKKWQEKNLVNTRDKIQSTLQDIEIVKYQWALEKEKGLSATPTEGDLLPYLLKFVSSHKYTSFPQHPPGGSYMINAVKYPPQSTQYGTWEDMVALDLTKTNNQSDPFLENVRIVARENFKNQLKGNEEILKNIAKLYGD
jgi:hypothetical protein